MYNGGQARIINHIGHSGAIGTRATAGREKGKKNTRFKREHSAGGNHRVKGVEYSKMVVKMGVNLLFSTIWKT